MLSQLSPLRGRGRSLKLGKEAWGKGEPGCHLTPPSSERPAGREGRRGKPGRGNSRLSLDPLNPTGSRRRQLDRNLRVSDQWGSRGLPPPPARLRALEPGGGAAGARGARRERALRAGGRVPRSRGCGAGAPERREGEGEGRGRDGGKEGGRGGGGRQQRPRTPRASHTCTRRSRAARRRPAPRSLLPPSSRSVAPALPARLRRRASGRAHRQTAPGTPRPAPPGRAMLIAPPGPARGISTARPAAPAASGDYEPESAALPGPPLSQPGHGLPPDRVRAARIPCTRVPAKLAWPGEGIGRWPPTS